MKKYKDPEMEIITLNETIITVVVDSEQETDKDQWGPLE